MKLKVLCSCLAILMSGGSAWALDEAVLTPTNTTVSAIEDRAFNAAMDVWMSHRYSEGKTALLEFAKQYPNNRWRAEAELHAACYLTFMGQYDEAKPMFTRLASEFKDTNIREKATVRLGNIAEREGRWDDAIKHYSSTLTMNPTWGQFKYANFRARKLYMTRNALQAKLNCGPVALSACLERLGRGSEALAARAIKATPAGISLFVLAHEAEKLGVRAQPVELPLASLKTAELPVLAHILPNHYLAILSIDGEKARVVDSIQGKREMALSDLERKWSGKVITFATAPGLPPLSLVAALETTGGCCGNADEDECLGCADGCSQSSSSSPSGGDESGGAGAMEIVEREVPGCLGCGGMAGPGPGDNGGTPCCDKSSGRPTWKVNTVNLNLLVSDTPIWYNPGKGFGIAFTLNCSNENSNTGIFGRGWRCVYDMKIFFLPGYDQNHPDLQVHRDGGRIETYEYNGSAYEPRSGMAAYGYRDEIKILNQAEAQAENISDGAGTVMLTLRGGRGKYFFKKAGSGATIEGRVYIIQDEVGNRVTCGFTDGCLSSVTDANDRVTAITTTGTGINERVTEIELPSGDERTATFEYTDGNLTSITDMLGDTSTLSYNALLPSAGAQQFSASTTTTQAVTTTDPATSNGTLSVASTSGFLSSGKIKVANNEEMSYMSLTAHSFTGITRTNPQTAGSGSAVTQVPPQTDLANDITDTNPANGGQLNVVSTAGFPSTGYIAVQSTNGTETINYTGKTSTAFTGITRGSPAYSAAAATSDVWLCKQTPYLSEIVTPAKKTKFTYEWWTFDLSPSDVAAIHEVHECGPTEDYPAVPTIHYAWCSAIYNEFTKITRYPTSVTAGASGCTDDTSSPAHWTAGLTRMHHVNSTEDALGYIIDEIGYSSNPWYKLVEYGYNSDRDRTSIKSYYAANSFRETTFTYINHDVTSMADPLGNTWYYTYTNHQVETEQDPYAYAANRYSKKYTHNSAGQVTKIETQLTPGTWTTLAENHYDAYGRLDWSKDGRGKQTDYHYNENGETRGFLTSVHDPENKATVYHYDAKGRRDQVTDPNGNTTTYEYDNLDRVTTVTNPDDTTIQTFYTCCHKDRVVDENGIAARYVYDRKNRPWVTVSAAKDGTLSQSLSDSATSIVLADASGFPTPPQGGYAVVVIQHKYSLCQSGCYQYAGLEVATYTGKSGNTLTGVTRGQYGSTAHAFDVDDRVTVGNVVVNGYDGTYHNRMISLTDALGHTTYYTYYLNGKLETIRYPDDKGERYTYDNSNSGNNLITKEYGTFSGTTFTPNADETIHYEYDANNRLVRTYH